MSERPPTILVVDDNDDNRELLARRLEREGLGVASAANGREALATVGRGGLSLVLLDIMMPDMSGLDVLRAIREVHGAAQLPVIMVTARSDSRDVVEALGMGANDYVTKPIDFAVALARIQAHLRIRQPPRPEADDVLRSPADVDVGMVLGGRYRLEAKIGTGSFGTVYRARHLELDHPVAVKVLQASAATSPEALARFRREGVAACRVKHRHAVAVLDFAVTARGVSYLVMELLAGYPLDQELAGGRQLPMARSLAIVAGVCEALAEAHRAGIVHRDVKPANVFLHQAQGVEVPKVLDFGIAALIGTSAVRHRVTADGWIVGTPVYMAPERFRSGPVDGRADVYSAGVMLYQMLTGRLPFEPDQSDPMAVAMRHLSEVPAPPSALRSDVAEPVERAILRALRKRADQRPSASEMAALLREAASAVVAR